MRKYLKHRWENYYQKPHWHLHLDIALILVMIMMAVLAVAINDWRPDLSAVINNPAWQNAWNERHQEINRPNLQIKVTPITTTIKNGEEVAYKIDYRNLENSGLTDLKIKLSTNDNYRAGAWRLATTSSELLLKGNEISFGNTILPQTVGSFIIKAPIKRVSAQGETALLLNLEVNYTTNEQTLNLSEVAAKVKILSDFKASVVAYYYSPEGDQLGVGPLPPIANQATVYYISLSATNLGNELDQIKITADLPAESLINGVRSVLAGNLNYDFNSSHISWTIDYLPADTKGQNFRAGLAIGILPTGKDVGHILNILNNIKYSAHDKVADQIISGELPNLTTNLPDDLQASGQGRVISGY